MLLPSYPNLIPISLDLQEPIKDIILQHKINISGFSFANLYLFRNKYNFNVALLENNLIITGAGEGKTFFSLVGNVLKKETLLELLSKYDYWRGVSEKLLEGVSGFISKEDICEDRNNFEYLYLQSDLAQLPGKDFQKKRNLVNAFIRENEPANIEQRKLEENTIKDALFVLDKWKDGKEEHLDYFSAKEALELCSELDFSGLVFYVKNTPVGYCQGEFLADGVTFSVHFEKSVEGYKGVYQYINQEFAKSLAGKVVYINREQDLGDAGLRQAKMTYRPTGFVKLFSIKASTKAS